MGNGTNKWTVGYRVSRDTGEGETFNRTRIELTQYYLADPWTKQFTVEKEGAYFFPDYKTARGWPKRAMIRAEAIKVWVWRQG